MIDLADKAENYEERTAMLNTLEARLVDVNLALQKISDGNYGKCEVSGEMIEEDRLMANPAARTCKAHMNS
jgi:RNA polymerase-binding transcription factor DksA